MEWVLNENENNGERVLEHYGQRPTAGKYGQYPPRSRHTINDEMRNTNEKLTDMTDACTEGKKLHAGTDGNERQDKNYIGGIAVG